MKTITDEPRLNVVAIVLSWYRWSFTKLLRETSGVNTNNMIITYIIISKRNIT